MQQQNKSELKCAGLVKRLRGAWYLGGKNPQQTSVFRTFFCPPQSQKTFGRTHAWLCRFSLGASGKFAAQNRQARND
jgi:hypothetical protein